jgi:YHS domain-containing protein
MTPIRFFITDIEDANREVRWQAPRFEKLSVRAKKLRDFSACDVNTLAVQSHLNMKTLKLLITLGLTAAFAAAPLAGFAEDKKEAAKPYPLDKCIVSDEKLGADPNMKEFVFIHEGQEIKLCCKSCQKDFKKAPAKYLKKLEGAGKADKK